MAVVGISEVARHLKAIYLAWRKIKTHIVQSRPGLVVLIDFPDFNFLLARLAKRHGIKVLYYISPQVWAWRSGRVHTLRRLVDEVAVILPFEAAFYERYQMAVHYVGHPLLDVLADALPREECAERYHPSSSAVLVGLLPGSRRSEIRLVLPVLMRAAIRLKISLPEVSFILPAARSLDRRLLEEEIGSWGLPVRIVFGDTYGAIGACDLVLATSGTVTLEAAILGTPMIIVNKLSRFSYYAGRHLVKVKYVGLPNLIAGRCIAPEFIQERARPELIAHEALTLLTRPEALERQRVELSAIRSRLGPAGVADRVARLVLTTADRQL
jgi:lipid-A-disaccharide synthase